MSHRRKRECSPSHRHGNLRQRVLEASIIDSDTALARSSDRTDCVMYEACLNLAIKNDKPSVCTLGCAQFVRRVRSV